MEIFLDLLSFGCCVDIQQYELYNIPSNTARLYQMDITVLLLRHNTVYSASQDSSFLKPTGRKFVTFGMVNVITYEGIIFSWIFKNWDVGVWTGSSWLRVLTGAGHMGLRY